MNRLLIAVIDGCAPEYLTPQTAPTLFALCRKKGFAKTVLGSVPTVTNVNHASILSGKFPEETKITGNYYYHPATREEGFIEERGFMKAPTLFQAFQKAGKKTALLTVKGKVLGIYGDGAAIGISAQTPDETLLSGLGLSAPPPIDSLSATEWIFQAALACIQRERPHFVYCTTNDYGFHHYAPGTPEALMQIRAIDRLIAAIHEADPDRQIYITADHGMNQKHHILDIQRAAAQANILLFALAPLKDRYVENHPYQEGGMAYLFLDHPEDAQRLQDFAKAQPEIEQLLTAKEAAQRYHLPADTIGDFVALAAPDCAFGETEAVRLYTDTVRTHGSLYERTVPLWAIAPEKPASFYQYTKDIARPFLSDIKE